jgi:hypothetical protein
MICKRKPQLFKSVKISRDTKIIVLKMLQQKSSKRPNTRLLLLCPCLVPHIAKVYLNLGRAYKSLPQTFTLDIFNPFINTSTK